MSTIDSIYVVACAVLDMSRHIPLYVCVLRTVRALRALRCRRLAPALRALPRLLASMSRTTNSYATKLRSVDRPVQHFIDSS